VAFFWPEYFQKRGLTPSSSALGNDILAGGAVDPSAGVFVYGAIRGDRVLLWSFVTGCRGGPLALAIPDVAHRGIKTTDEGLGWCPKRLSAWGRDRMGSFQCFARTIHGIKPFPSAFTPMHRLLGAWDCGCSRRENQHPSFSPHCFTLLGLKGSSIRFATMSVF